MSDNVLTGAPEEIRTPDPQIRSLVLYPAELRAQRRSVIGDPSGDVKSAAWCSEMRGHSSFRRGPAAASGCSASRDPRAPHEKNPRSVALGVLEYRRILSPIDATLS